MNFDDLPFIPKMPWSDEDIVSVKELAGKLIKYADKSDEHSLQIGRICTSWAGLNVRIDSLFQPLLQCSEAQVACILIENIGARSEMLKKLVHLETELPHDWVDWFCALLDRASRELAAKRNRYVHDTLRQVDDKKTKIDKRAKIKKPDAGARKTVHYQTEVVISEEELTSLDMQISTVATALWAATYSLQIWRETGQVPDLDPQWIPASKPTARHVNYIGDGSAPHIPYRKLQYEFD